MESLRDTHNFATATESFDFLRDIDWEDVSWIPEESRPEEPRSEANKENRPPHLTNIPKCRSRLFREPLDTSHRLSIRI